MRYLLTSLLFAALSGCDSPSPKFMGAEVSRQYVGGNAFSVYRKDMSVQAIRTNVVKRPDIRVIARQAELAMEQATGCPVTEIFGDVAVLNGRLDCAKPVKEGEWAEWKQPRRATLICDGYSSLSRWSGWEEISIECY